MKQKNIVKTFVVMILIISTLFIIRACNSSLAEIKPIEPKKEDYVNWTTNIGYIGLSSLDNETEVGLVKNVRNHSITFVAKGHEKEAYEGTPVMTPALKKAYTDFKLAKQNLDYQIALFWYNRKFAAWEKRMAEEEAEEEALLKVKIPLGAGGI